MRNLLQVLATVCGTAFLWWVWHPLGVVAGIVSTGFLRKWLGPLAWLWTSPVILSIGLVLGAVMASAVYFATSVSTTSRLVSAFLYFEGLLAVGYVGFEPPAFDIHQKAGQVAVVGSLCYLVALLTMSVLLGWPR